MNDPPTSAAPPPVNLLLPSPLAAGPLAKSGSGARAQQTITTPASVHAALWPWFSPGQFCPQGTSGNIYRHSCCQDRGGRSPHLAQRPTPHTPVPHNTGPAGPRDNSDEAQSPCSPESGIRGRQGHWGLTAKSSGFHRALVLPDLSLSLAPLTTSDFSKLLLPWFQCAQVYFHTLGSGSSAGGTPGESPRGALSWGWLQKQHRTYPAWVRHPTGGGPRRSRPSPHAPALHARVAERRGPPNAGLLGQTA